MVHRRPTLLTVLLVVGWLLSFSGATYALDGRFDSNHFTPPTDNYGLFTMDSSKIYQKYRFGAGFYLHFMDDSLEVNQLGQDGKNHIRDLVGPRLKMDIAFAAAFCRFYETGFDLPVLLYQDGAALDKTNQNFSHAAFGDIRWHNKFVALHRDRYPVGLAFVNTLIFPSGDPDSYFGNNGVGSEFKAVIDAELGSFLVVGNLGYRIRDEVVIFKIRDGRGKTIFSEEIDDELLLSLGGQYRTPLDGLSVLTEFRMSTLAESPFDQRMNTPFLWDLGVRYLGPMGFSFSGALELGLSQGYGVPPAGFFANVAWTWDKPDKDKDGLADKEDQCPEAAEDEDGFEDEDGCPDPDNDKDGVPDAEDECPLDAEDPDDFHDEDGCPDLDNDDDTILDAEDQCPLAAEDFNEVDDADGCPDFDTDRDGLPDVKDGCTVEPEDKDGFEDEDGCPDPDNDKDGVPDVDDKCPLEPEDKDGFEDADGCPDPDNDRDGFKDADDQCPEKPETINGNEDQDGCPDEGEPVVIDQGDHLEIKTRVRFVPDAARAEQESYTVLNQIGLVLRARGDAYDKIVVEAHTSNRGDVVELKNRSELRAKWVRAYLMGMGLNGKKMEAKGYGASKPIDSNFSRRGREKNERLEIRILGGKKPEPVPEAEEEDLGEEPPLALPPLQMPKKP